MRLEVIGHRPAHSRASPKIGQNVVCAWCVMATLLQVLNGRRLRQTETVDTDDLEWSSELSRETFVFLFAHPIVAVVLVALVRVRARPSRGYWRALVNSLRRRKCYMRKGITIYCINYRRRKKKCTEML